MRISNCLAAVIFLSCVHPIVNADWPRFRGPNGTGLAEGSAPVKWSESENLKWKIELPGPGVSSPIVVGDKVLVTSYSGYGESRDDIGAMKDLVRHLSCYDASNGNLLWQKDVPNEVQEDEFGGIGVPAHGYASHTPTSDGERVYAFFGKTGVIAFDMEGNELWRKSLGTDSDPRRWGSSSSPIVHEDVLVVTAGPESRAIVGLNKESGEELWRADADGFGQVWGTPAVVTAGDKSEIVIGAPYEIWAISPKDGKLNWYCEAIESDSFNSSVLIADDMVYAIEGRRGGGSVAIRAGGVDDVSKSNVVWSGNDAGAFGSPVHTDGRIYQISSGTISCLDAKTGDEIFKSRLSSGGSGSEARNSSGGGGRRGGRGGGMMGNLDYPSPVIADGKLYYLNGKGEMYVLEAGKEYKLLSVNRVTSAPESFGGTPAIADGCIFLRSNKNLYCVAQD